MKKYKNICCIIILITILSNVSYSQLYVGPSLGVNHHYIEVGENNTDFQVINPFNPTLSVGLKTELMLTSSVSVSMLNNYSRKKLGAGDRGFVPLTGIEYQSINTYLSLNKNIFSNCFIGLGLNYLFTPKINWIYSTQEPLTTFKNRSDIGGGVSINYTYKNLVLDFNYGYSFIEWNKYKVENIILPISMLQMHLSYLFKTN